MPLPPRNPNSAGQLCPRMAHRPPRRAPQSPHSPLSRPATAPAGRPGRPWPRPPSRVRTLGAQPMVRSTLVVPAFLLPTCGVCRSGPWPCSPTLRSGYCPAGSPRWRSPAASHNNSMSIVLFFALSEDKPQGRALKAKGLAQLIVQVPLVGEVDQGLVVDEDTKVGGCTACWVA